MDKEFLSEIIQFILWSFGVFTLIVSGMITLFYFLGKAYLNSVIEITVKKSEKNEEMIIENQTAIRETQKDLKEIAATNHESIEIIKVEQKHSMERLRVFEETFFNLKKKRNG